MNIFKFIAWWWRRRTVSEKVPMILIPSMIVFLASIAYLGPIVLVATLGIIFLLGVSFGILICVRALRREYAEYHRHKEQDAQRIVDKLRGSRG
jgi:fatty acid desaturase